MLQPSRHPFSHLLARAAHALPSQCAVCRAWGSARVCGPCSQRFAPMVLRCTGCAAKRVATLPAASAFPAEPATRCGACTTTPLGLDACHAAVDYAYPWDGIIAQLKFAAGQPALADLLADVMAQQPHIVGALASADVVVPIPLSAQRLQERGFNQALELAHALCRTAPHTVAWQKRTARLGSPVDATLLLRLGSDKLSQVGLPRAQRMANARGAFAVEPLRAQQLQGLRVLVVDDVSTTGATLAAASQALRLAGAAEVVGVVFAKTPV